MPPAARNLAEEGQVIAPTYLVEQGRPRWDAIRALLLAGPHPTRNVEDNLADLRAAAAANHAGATALQRLAAQHGAEKIKTIGDGYMAATGLPDPDPAHVAHACDLALAMVEAMPALNAELVETMQADLRRLIALEAITAAYDSGGVATLQLQGLYEALERPVAVVAPADRTADPADRAADPAGSGKHPPTGSTQHPAPGDGSDQGWVLASPTKEKGSKAREKSSEKAAAPEADQQSPAQSQGQSQSTQDQNERPPGPSCHAGS